MLRALAHVACFQAVLETIRALMNAECVVPDWLHDTFLGYGDPSAANYIRYTHLWGTEMRMVWSVHGQQVYLPVS